MDASPSRRARVLGLVAVVLVGVNLRPAITSVAALLDDTAAHFALDGVTSTLLVTLPVIAFGATAPLGPWLARRIGVARALAIAMAVLALALALRAWVPGTLLWGTVIAGAAIMAAGTLLPQYLKALSASGLWVGISTMSFSVGAALGAGLTAPLEAATGSVPVALGVWTALAAAAALTMAAGARHPEPVAGSGRPRLALPRGGAVTLALVTAIFGLQALLYFALTAWLPRFVADNGVPAAGGGALLAWFSLIGLAPTLVTPVLARRPRVLRWFGPALGVVIAGGYAWLLFADPAQYLWVVSLLGIAQSAAFALAVSLIVTLSADAVSAGVVSAAAQGAGYVIAGLGSFGIGLVHDTTDAWWPSFALMIGVALALAAAVAGVLGRRPVDLVAAAGSSAARLD